MTDYKMVPVKPTPEMLAAGKCALEYYCFVDEIYADMLAAAPEVEQEPVGWVWHSYNQTNFTTGSHHKEVLEADGVKLTPVYAAPQPAVQAEPVAEVVWPDVEGRHGGFRQFGHSSSPRLPAGTKLYMHPQPAVQQPSADALTPVPDELFAAEFSAWWEHHGQFCRAGGGTYEKSFAFEAWRHLYPQLMNLRMTAEEQQPELAKHQPCGCVICTCEHETQCQGCGGHHCGTHPGGQLPNPVYQQPAEQPPLKLPGFVIGPDDSDECASLWDHGFKRGWNACLEAVAKTMRSAEQQPKPDVAALVEALEEILDPVRFMQERLEEGERLNVLAAVQLAKDASYLKVIAKAALAAYRNSGAAERE